MPSRTAATAQQQLGPLVSSSNPTLVAERNGRERRKAKSTTAHTDDIANAHRFFQQHEVFRQAISSNPFTVTVVNSEFAMDILKHAKVFVIDCTHSVCKSHAVFVACAKAHDR